MESSLLIYILLFPLLGALINGLLAFFGKDLGNYAHRRLGWSQDVFLKKTSLLSSYVGVGVVFISFCLGFWCYVELIGMGERRLTQNLFTWVQSGSLKLDFAFQFDVLSCLMVLVVTGVGALIHLYSVGYMHGDKGYCRYFSYLNFFIFAMLILVLGNNLVVLFIGWEGVGLASYLLIGFWYTDPEKARAGKKAFITNRIGDFGFILGALLLFALCSKLAPLDAKFGFDKITLSFDQIHTLIANSPGHISPIFLTIAALCLFFGACGKSAQIPLYVWLPDAMAGPTPVSALIHAATMVTAGVYMVVRLNVLYLASPTAMAVIAIVGGATALFAATIGLVQTDIKKVLAYSTVSQLGYMFLACGVGAYIIAMFHLITHAFFKACLFLGSGSVIHGMHGEQNIQKMGGLKAKMPITFWTFLLATLSIAGFPLLAGFMSKDEILAFAYGSKINGSIMLWSLGIVTALCTSFYMFRLVYLTFCGENRSSHEGENLSEAEHVHESPFVMTVVLQILAGLSVIGGFIGVPHFLGGSVMPNFLERWLEPIVPVAHFAHKGALGEWSLMLASIAIAFAGLGIAYSLYGKKSDRASSLSCTFARTHRLLLNKYFVDEIYEKLIFRPIHGISNWVLFRGVDKACIDGCVNFSGRLCQFISRQTLKLQQGDVQYYLLYMVLGLLVFTTVIFFNIVK